MDELKVKIQEIEIMIEKADADTANAVTEAGGERGYPHLGNSPSWLFYPACFLLRICAVLSPMANTIFFRIRKVKQNACWLFYAKVCSSERITI